jgi:hypothetical protein
MDSAVQLLLHIVTVVCSNIPSDGTVDRFADDHPRRQTIKASVRQYITERPSLEEDSERVEYATAAEPAGTISTTGEPKPISSEDEQDQEQSDSRLLDSGPGRQATFLDGAIGVQTSLSAFYS